MESNYEEQKIDLEDQFILRLPLAYAETVRAGLKKKSKKFKKLLQIQINNDSRSAIVYLNKKPLNSTLYDLPTIIESNKIIDNINLYKTADISQILICDNQPKPEEKTEAKIYLFPHGITPPLKNVRKFRFRKTLINNNDVQESADIEKEVLMLLRMDNEAISTRYEFLYEVEKPEVKIKEREKTIFGDLSDFDSKSSSSESENDIMDFTR